MAIQLILIPSLKKKRGYNWGQDWGSGTRVPCLESWLCHSLTMCLEKLLFLTWASFSSSAKGRVILDL